MEQYIPKSALVAEIEKWISGWTERLNTNPSNSSFFEGGIELGKYILFFIDTIEVKEMQEEPVSEKKCMFTKDNYTDEDRMVLCEDCNEKCEYSKKEEPVSEGLEETAESYAVTDEVLPNGKVMINFQVEKAFRAGAKWQIAKLMANATDVTVHIDAGGYPYIPQIELYDYDKDIPLAKEGDRYKVILIKEN